MTQFTVTYYVYWFCECQKRKLERVVSMIVWGRQSHAYIIKHPNWNTIDPCDGIHYIRYSDLLRVLILWCQSSTTGGGGLHELVRESSLMLHNQAPIQHIDFLWWNTLISTDITTWWFVSARAAQLEDGWSQRMCEGERLMLTYQAPNLNTLDSLWWNTLTSVRDITTCIICECPTHNWRTDVPIWLCEGEQSHAYISTPNWKHNWLLVMEYTTLGSGITTCIVLWVQSSTTGGGWSPMIVWGRAVMLTFKTQFNHNWLLVCYTIRYSELLLVLFCEWQAGELGRMVSNELYEGEQSPCFT